jgi:GNAT superfamily N-acetyltransferase
MIELPGQAYKYLLSESGLSDDFDKVQEGERMIFSMAQMQAFLDKKYAEGLSPLSKQLDHTDWLGNHPDFKDEKGSDARLEAVLVRPGMDMSHVYNGIGLVGSAFGPTQEMTFQETADASNIPNLWARSALSVTQGRPYRIYESEKTVDESTALYIYTLDKTCVGIGGIYRDLQEPDTACLSRVAVSPAFRKRGLHTRFILPHALILARMMKGSDTIRFFTEKHDNQRTIDHYNRLGAGWEDRTINYAGSEQLCGCFRIPAAMKLLREKHDVRIWYHGKFRNL